MKRFIRACSAALLLGLIALLCPTLAHAGEVTVLPEDGTYYYVSLMGQPGETKFETLKDGFLHNPKLASLHNFAHVSVLPTTEKLFQERYAKTIPSLPCVRVLTPDGTVVYQASGTQTPATADALAGKILPLCPKPSPTPNPSPTPGPSPGPSPDVTPDSPVPDSPTSSFPPVWALLIAVIVGAGIGFADYWKHSS